MKGKETKKRVVLPTPHEMAILRRLARPGAYLMVTFQDDDVTMYCYEDGREIHGVSGGGLTTAGFRRLTNWLVPVDGESLLEDGPPQRWTARKAV